MKHGMIRLAVLAAGFFLAVCGIALWSWNTLATLTDLPSAGFRHAIAAIALLAILRLLLRLGRGRHRSLRRRDLVRRDA